MINDAERGGGIKGQIEIVPELAEHAGKVLARKSLEQITDTGDKHIGITIVASHNTT